ncbi:MAG: serine/threonine protein kinase [bacterium]|nr:serine/threonine protein kinase [bacterium]
MKWSDLQLVRELGEGAAGSVWLADNNDRRTRDRFPRLAVKRYKQWVLEQPGQMERIVRELHIGRTLRHPNLVQTLELVLDEAKLPVLVMSFCEGETLEDYLKARDYRLSHDEIVGILTGLAEALQTLHESGVLHRDIKPANVMISGGKPILMDLGVIRPEKFPEQTTTGAFLGTIRYAAPEMLFGLEYDQRADLYSLGLIAFELTVGSRYLGDMENFATLITHKPSPLRESASSVVGLGGSSKRDYGWPAESAYLLKEYGPAVSHFWGYVLNRLLRTNSDERPSDPQWLTDLLKAEIWRRPFTIEDDELMECQPTIHIPSKGGSGRDVPLEEACRIYQERIPCYIRTLILKELEENYFTRNQVAISETRIRRPDLDAHESYAPFLSLAHHPDEPLYVWSESDYLYGLQGGMNLRLLHRYGYLNEEWDD